MSEISNILKGIKLPKDNYICSLSESIVSGNGKGKEIGFPTFNMEVEEINIDNSLNEGVYTTILPNHHNIRCVSQISKYKGKFRIETHILEEQVHTVNRNHIISRIRTNDRLTILFLKKIREHAKVSSTSNLLLMIKDDIQKSNDFFSKFNLCNFCKFCYIQDYGYSNYTVTDSSEGCLLELWEEEIDQEQELKLSKTYTRASNCTSYEEGEGEIFDVDGTSERPPEDFIISKLKSHLRESKLDDLGI